MDKTTFKWWINRSKDLEERNLALEEKLKDAMTIIAEQKLLSLRLWAEIIRLERNQHY